ncbi:MAG: hypothetical protein ACRCSN_07675 [Dermatophilaceae bacterium]
MTTTRARAGSAPAGSDRRAALSTVSDAAPLLVVPGAAPLLVVPGAAPLPVIPDVTRRVPGAPGFAVPDTAPFATCAP